MASVSDAPAQVLVTDDDLALAEQRFEDGSEAFDEDDFEAASDLLAQAVEVKAAKYGEHDIRVVPAYLKYAQALLGCARNQDDNVLGALKTAIKPDPKPASTSSGVTRPDAVDASAAAEGDDDLNLAWETAEVARVTLYQAAETDESAVSPEDLAEVHEILADISSERESFDDAITDFQQALRHLDRATEKDQRWQAELNFKVSLPLQIMDRVPEATDHIVSALAQMKSHLKQKVCHKEQLEAEAKAAAEAGVPEAASAPAASAEDATANGTAASTAAEEAGAAAAGVTEGGNEAETDLQVAERELKQLRSVLQDLEERKAELVAAVDEGKAVKDQLRAMMGGLSGAAPGAGTSTATAAAPAPARVQDLGVKGTAKVADAVASKEDTENGGSAEQPATKRARNY